MNFRFTGVGVDSGTIMICDEDYYGKYGYKFEKGFSFKRKVPKGSYRCSWSIPRTWNRSVDGNGYLEVTSGMVVVSDPCYCVESSNWDKVINDTDFLQKLPRGVLLLDKMGGDGVYTVHVSLESI